eukprot:6747116-Prymnesium_polylepis.1
MRARYHQTWQGVLEVTVKTEVGGVHSQHSSGLVCRVSVTHAAILPVRTPSPLACVCTALAWRS